MSRDTESPPTGGPFARPGIELLRDDLAELLYESTKLKAEFLFGDSIAALDDDGTAVRVTSSAPARTPSTSSSGPTACTPPCAG